MPEVIGTWQKRFVGDITHRLAFNMLCPYNNHVLGYRRERIMT
jgi:hypothetical protein